MRVRELQITLLLGFIVFCICACKYGSESKLKFKYPSLLDVSGNTSLACQAIAFAGIWGEAENIEADVLKGTDKLAIKINDDKTLSLMTQASVGVGITDPGQFHILRNDEAILLAVQYEEPLTGSSVNTFALDRKNGLAIWSKTSPKYMFLNKPVGQIMYLACK